MALSYGGLSVYAGHGAQCPGHPPAFLPQRRRPQPEEPGAPENQPTGAPVPNRVLISFLISHQQCTLIYINQDSRCSLAMIILAVILNPPDLDSQFKNEGMGLTQWGGVYGTY